MLEYYNFFPHMPSKLLQLNDSYEDSDPQLIESYPHQLRSTTRTHTNPQQQYYEEYLKLYLTSFKLKSEYLKQINAQSLLTQRITHIETHFINLNRKKRQQQFEQESHQAALDQKSKSNKRNRRTAQQIQRKYECPHQYCGRCYGSDGSLQQHLKTKHAQVYKSKQGVCLRN